MSDSKKKKELEIDEEKAYAELCEIIAEAIQTQDANLLEVRIAEWKRKYPYNKFSKNLKAKIDYILNQYYSELIEYIIKSIKIEEEKKKFDQGKSLVELYKIIKYTNDSKDLEKKVKSWKSKYPIDNFMKMYKKKVEKYTSQKYLEENSFDTEKAFYDLYYMLKTNSTFDELKEKVSIWEKNYSIGERYDTDDFKKHSSEVKSLLNEEYLYSIAKEEEKEDNIETKENSLAIQLATFTSFTEVLKTNDMAKVVEWIYKNRNISFNNFYKEQIIAKTAFEFPVSMLDSKDFKMDLNKPGLSFEEYQNIDSSRKYIIAMFINNLIKEQSQSENTLQDAFNKSEIAKSFKKSNKDKENSVVKNQKEAKPVDSINNKTEEEETIPLIKELSNDKIKEESNNKPIIENLSEEKKEKSEIIDVNAEKKSKSNNLENETADLVDNSQQEKRILGLEDEEEKTFEVKNKEERKTIETEDKKEIKLKVTEENVNEESKFSSEVIIFNPDFITAVYVKSNLATQMPQTIEKVDEMVSNAVKEEPMEQKEFIFSNN